VVVYLRAIYDPIRRQLEPNRKPGELFPLISSDQLAAAGPENPRRLAIEIGREAATIIMLAAVGLAAGRNFRERMAAFAIVFGLWDLFFYVFLRLLIGWPDSLFTWDILFLIPLPWVGPVIAPALISVTLIVCGLYSFVNGGLPASKWQWLAMVAGGVVVILSFLWDVRNTMAGGLPNPFNWPLFLTGEAIALGGFIWAAKSPEFQESRIPLDS